MSDRCPVAIRFGNIATRCDRRAGHRGDDHEGPGLSRFPEQRIQWLAGDRREFDCDREDEHAWDEREP